MILYYIISTPSITYVHTYEPVYTITLEEGNILDVNDLRRLIKSVLTDVDLYSENAEELLVFTAATESMLGEYLYQIKGPARGIFQMEPTTEKDIWENCLRYKDSLHNRVSNYCTFADDSLTFNLGYQIVMARIHYLRVPEKLPNKDDVQAMAAYYKKYWNTIKGKANITEAINKYNIAVQNT